jgi:hypothetical protein
MSSTERQGAILIAPIEREDYRRRPVRQNFIQIDFRYLSHSITYPGKKKAPRVMRRAVQFGFQNRRALKRSCEPEEQLITPSFRVNHKPFKNVAEGIQSIITSVALIGGGIWALWRFVRHRESVTKVDLDIDLSFVIKQGANWIVEGVAVVKHPGSVRLDFSAFTYELHYALPSDDFGGQNAIEEGIAKENTLSADSLPLRHLLKHSWFEGSEDIYLEPGERSRYSFLAFLPIDTTMVVLTCELYDPKKHVEIVRKSYAVPGTPAQAAAGSAGDSTTNSAS